MEVKTRPKSIIKDARFLRPDYAEIAYKEELVFIRKEQAKELFNMLNPETKIQPPVDVEYFGDGLKYIWGWKGTGKTTMLRWFENYIRGMEAQVIYINARYLDSPNKLIHEVYERFKRMYPEFKPEHTTNERYATVEYIEQIKDKQIFLIIDEIDKPLRNSKSAQPDEFLHYLIRLITENKEGMFKVIFSTNIVHIERFFSEEVLSFLAFKKILFGVYTVPEMVDILERRCREALVPGSYNGLNLTMIAHIVHETLGGDMRYALDMLHKLARISEGKLDMEKLPQVSNELNFEILKDEVITLPRGVQVLLKSILVHSKKEHGCYVPTYFTTDELYDNYIEYCNTEGYKASKKAMFYRYLNTLKTVMLVKTTPEGNEIGEDPDVLMKCLENIL